MCFENSFNIPSQQKKVIKTKPKEDVSYELSYEDNLAIARYIEIKLWNMVNKKSTMKNKQWTEKALKLKYMREGGSRLD